MGTNKTTKLLCLSAILVGLQIMNCNAQENTFVKGQKDLAFGTGFGSPWIGGGYYLTFPPLSASLDYGLRDDIGPGVIGVGGFIGVGGYRYKYPIYDYGRSYTTILFGARGTYHYQFIKKLDTYGGLVLGLRTYSSKVYGTWPGDNYVKDSGISPLGSIFIGGKYYFTESVSAFAEVGYGIGIFTLGASFKL
jgi:hypothetical protein